MQEHTDSLKWIWLMDWCKSNRFNPANQYYWKLAEEAYIREKKAESCERQHEGRKDCDIHVSANQAAGETEM